MKCEELSYDAGIGNASKKRRVMSLPATEPTLKVDVEKEEVFFEEVDVSGVDLSSNKKKL